MLATIRALTPTTVALLECTIGNNELPKYIQAAHCQEDSYLYSSSIGHWMLSVATPGNRTIK